MLHAVNPLAAPAAADAADPADPDAAAAAAEPPGRLIFWISHLVGRGGCVPFTKQSDFCMPRPLHATTVRAISIYRKPGKGSLANAR